MQNATERDSNDPRLVARADKETKKFIAQAAELAGVTTSQFIVESARARAEEVMDRMARIRVTVETGNRIMSILDRAPQKPSSKLMQDALEYKENIDDTETDNYSKEAQA